MKKILSNLNGLNNALKNAKGGDELELSPGNYKGDIILDKRYNSEVIVNLNNVQIEGTGPYTLDLKGANIKVNIEDSQILKGNSAGIAQRGDNIKLLGKNTLITDNNFGLTLLGANHITKGLRFQSQVTGGINGNNLKLDPIKRTVSQGFNWGPSNNWRITECSFYDISPFDPGNAGGGIRLIPHVKDVMVDNCHFDNIDGNALWTDHAQDGIEWYYNTFRKVTGKQMFLEICDPNMKDLRGFIARIAGNVSLDGNERHGVAIMASAGLNAQNNIEIFANNLNGWPIVCAGMPRDFYRRFDHKDNSTWENIDARLEHIEITENVLEASTKNHIMLYNGVGSGPININGNYYVTGNESEFRGKKEIVGNAKFSINNGKFLHGVDHEGINVIDKNGFEGPKPSEFPFKDAYKRIPVGRTNENLDGNIVVIPDPIIDIPDPDPVIVDPPQSNDIPNVWIVSDYSSITDKDDHCAMSFALLCATDRYKIKGITVGAHPLAEDRNPLELYNDTHGKALKDEQGIDYPVYLADNWGNRFKNNIIYGDSVAALIDEIGKHTKENPLYILNWGPMTEIAVMVHELIAIDSPYLDNFVIVSHFTQKSTDNNYRKDKEATEYLKEKALSVIDFIELDRAGADKIDDKTFPKISDSVLNSKIGKYFGEKWQNNKPDFSDGATLIAVAFNELGFGKTFLEQAVKNGDSNLALFNGIFGDQKGKLYKIIEQAAKDSIEGVVVIPDPVIIDPPEKSEAQTLIEEIEVRLKKLKLLIE